MSQSAEAPAEINQPVESQANVGFQRQMSTRSITALALAGCLGAAELLPVGIGIGLWPSADLGRALAFATGFNIILVLLYASIGAILPRSGADYVFTSRVLPAPLAFAGSFSLLIMAAIIVGALAVLISQAVLSPFLYYTALIAKDADLASIASTFAHPQGAIIIGTIVVLLAFLLSILSPKANSRFMWICILLALAGWGAIFFQLATADPTGFTMQWDRVIGEGSYIEQIPTARSLSLVFSDAPGGLILAGIPLGFLIFYGARLSISSSNEVQGAVGRSQFIGGLLAVLVCGALAAGSTLLVARSIPPDWLAAESHLFLYDQLLEIPALPWLPLYATLLRPIYPLFVISTLGILAALIAGLQVFLRSFGRVIAVWADDFMMPDLAGYIHPVSQTPLIGILLVAILAEIGVSFVATLGVMQTLYAALFTLLCLQIIPALAAILYPLAQRRWAKSSLPESRQGNPRLLTICGLLTLIYTGWMIAIVYIYPAAGNSIGILDWALLAGSLAVGLVWFLWRARLLRRRQGIDAGQLFRKLPGE